MSEYIFPQSDTLAESYPKLQEELKRQNEEDKRLQREITANKADIEKKLEQHKTSDDHTADKIRYDGKIPKDNVKDALDETDTRIDNIVSQGGSDNTEVVDARHSTTKDKTYDTLKGRLEDGEQDIEKLKTDTNVAESVTETSYDSVIPVPDSAVNGQVSGVVRGLTATNLVENGNFNNGTARWNSAEVTNFQAINNEVSFTTTSRYGNINQTLSSHAEVGDTIYARAFIKSANDNIRLQLSHKTGYSFATNVYSGGNIYEKLSIMGVVPEDTNFDTLKLMIQDHNVSDWQTIYVKNVIAVNLTQTFGEGNEPTKEECDQIFANYFDGTKSTIGSARVKSVGKNLINESEVLIEHGFEKTHEGYVLTNNDKVFNKIIWKNENMSYKGQIAVEINAKSEGALIGSYPRIIYSDGTETLVYYIANSGFNTKHVISQSGKIVDKITWKYGNWDSKTTIKHLMISKDINSEYEPYIEDRAYVTAVKDNKIVNLRSLPNGVADEIDLEHGKMIKKISDELVINGGDVEDSSIGDNTIRFSIDYSNLPKLPLSNVDNSGIAISDDGEYPIVSKFTGIRNVLFDEHNKKLYIRLETEKLDSMPSGRTYDGGREYLNQYPITLTYQLAEPEIIPIRWTGLQAYEGGTVYVDTVIPELGFYYDNGLESHYPDHPIQSIDTLYRVDKETGYKEPLDVSKCEIREDRLSFTHPDLVDGDLCDWDYVPMTENTRPETTFEFPTNLKASVNSLLDAEQINKKEHNIFKARLDNHDRDIERIDDDIKNAQVAIDTAQSDIDTHKADKNNPHGVTPQQIGAETPSGSQAKADAVQNELITHEGKTEIHRKITISYTEPTNPSVNDIWIDLNPIIKTKTLADWRINEDNGVTILDWSGNGYHGEVVGNVSITSSINDGSAYSITGDGETGFIKTPFNALQGIDNFKITLYAKRNQDKTGWTSLVNNYRDSNGNKKGWHISYINDYRGLSSNIYTTHGSTDNNLETNFTMVLNTIYWIELEYTGEQAIFKCYEVKTNGNLELKVSKTTPLTGLVNVGMRPLTLLANNSVTTAEFAPFTLGKIKINTERKED